AATPALQHPVCTPAGVTSFESQAAQKVGGGTASEEKDRKPQRNHAHDGKIGEIDVFNHPVAENVDLRTKRRCQVLAAGEVAIQGIEGNGCDRETNSG